MRPHCLAFLSRNTSTRSGALTIGSSVRGASASFSSCSRRAEEHRSLFDQDSSQSDDVKPLFPGGRISARKRPGASSSGGPSSAKPPASSSTAAQEAVQLPGMPTTAPAQFFDSEPAQFGYTKDSLPFRVDPILERFINILMKDGKKQRASRQVHKMLELLSQMTRTNPVVALSRAIQQASPLTRMQSQRQGARTLQVPIALNERQGQRRAIQGIINASEKRNDRDLSARLALEVCAVLDGTSNVLAKKEEAHKIATMNRSNLSTKV